MPGFGITYFQDTVKDRQMENLCTKSIKMCPCPYLLKPHHKHLNITPTLSHVQVEAEEEDTLVQQNSRFLGMCLCQMIVVMTFFILMARIIGNEDTRSFTRQPPPLQGCQDVFTNRKLLMLAVQTQIQIYISAVKYIKMTQHLPYILSSLGKQCCMSESGRKCTLMFYVSLSFFLFCYNDTSDFCFVSNNGIARL